MHPSSTPWKQLKKFMVFWCFRGVEKGCIGNNWIKQYLATLWLYDEVFLSTYSLRCRISQKFQFCRIKLTSNTNPNNCALSNSAIKLKKVELVVSINSRSVGKIATYVGKLLLIFKSISLCRYVSYCLPTMVFPRTDVSNIFWIPGIKY